ncbi:unnamed protein product [Arabidopsis halleri]
MDLPRTPTDFKSSRLVTSHHIFSNVKEISFTFESIRKALTREAQ